MWVVMGNRRAWLAEWCPYCRVSPGARCREKLSRPNPVPAPRMHVARGWRVRPCPTCRALAGEPCRTPSGREASRPHVARFRSGRGELLWHEDVWEDLQRRGAGVAFVPFAGRAGLGGRIGTITLSRCRGDELIDLELWTGRDELAYALE